MLQPDPLGHHPINSPLDFAVRQRDAQVLRCVSDALDRGDVLLAYQPVVQAETPHRTAFFEGLLRVNDASGRIVPARDFIDAVETTELGRRLDCRALELGLDVLARHPQLRLSINMSARSIACPAWIDALNRGVQAAPEVAGRLILEITESSAIVMPDAVAAFMSQLQSHGISFALDDFGAGYTSFRYLKELLFDIVKIDGQFVRGIHADPDNQVLAQALCSIARHFDMFTVAESVEEAADAAMLRQIGIDCLQGFHFGAPSTRPAWAAAQVRASA